MKRAAWIALWSLVLTGWTAVATEAQEEPTLQVTHEYTAQRRPRVTVLEFDDTNSDAQGRKYGASVEAMLVTFLKSKSQLVVVERQKVERLVEEWKRNQAGLTIVQPGDPDDQLALERIDAIILGSVTLIGNAPVHNPSRVAAEAMKGKGLDPLADRDEQVEREAPVERGDRIEIDVKVLSRIDGRIITAAQRSGPIWCLRSIVERLGVALEQGFLRPYYGTLTFQLSEPANVRVFLTPILAQDALDEEKPPVELGSTVIQDRAKDIVEPWTTDPSSYTIRNVLSGWYSMRLARPGYEGLGTNHARWEVRRGSRGEPQVWDRASKMPLKKVPPDLQRFVVRVDPLRTDVVEGDQLGFVFHKKGGSFAPRIKRQYLDEAYDRSVQMRVSLVGTDQLDLNKLERPEEYEADEFCPLFEEKMPNQILFGDTLVASGEKLDFERFEGGKVVIADYQGEVLPVGRYQMRIEEPGYVPYETTISVHHQDDAKAVHGNLERLTGPLVLTATGPRPGQSVILEGKVTGRRIELPLEFLEDHPLESLPVDTYAAATDIPGLTAWRRHVEVVKVEVAPTPEADSSKAVPEAKEAPAPEVPEKPPAPSLRIKTRLCVAGRIDGLRSRRFTVDDIYVETEATRLLDELLPPRTLWLKDRRLPRWLKREGLNLANTVLVALDQSGEVPAEFPLKDLRRGIDKLLNPPPPEAPADESAKNPPVSEPPQPPLDPRILRAALESHLRDVDLLILDDIDMALLDQQPEVADIIARWVAAGGSLFAFVTLEGDYSSIMGAPLKVSERAKKTRRFELARGLVAGVELQSGREKVKVRPKRGLPLLKKIREAGWRVLAYTQGERGPRIIERGLEGPGGYVLVWADHFRSLDGRKALRSEEVLRVRAAVEERVLRVARQKMHLRYGVSSSSAEMEQARLP